MHLEMMDSIISIGLHLSSKKENVLIKKTLYYVHCSKPEDCSSTWAQSLYEELDRTTLSHDDLN